MCIHMQEETYTFMYTYTMHEGMLMMVCVQCIVYCYELVIHMVVYFVSVFFLIMGLIKF